MMHVTVRFDNGEIVKVEPTSFSQAGGGGRLSRRQIPLKLGWALTVHRAQGMYVSQESIRRCASDFRVVFD